MYTEPLLGIQVKRLIWNSKRVFKISLKVVREMEDLFINDFNYFTLLSELLQYSSEWIEPVISNLELESLHIDDYIGSEEVYDFFGNKLE